MVIDLAISTVLKAQIILHYLKREYNIHFNRFISSELRLRPHPSMLKPRSAAVLWNFRVASLAKVQCFKMIDAQMDLI